MPLDFRLDDELAAFRAEAHDFLAAETAAERVAGHLDPTDLTGLDETFEREHQRRAGERGFLGISAPEEYGGGGRPSSWASVYMFEAAYFDAPSIDTAWTLCGAPVRAFGSDDQRRRYLPAMVAGSITGCIAYSEAQAGSDLGAVAMTAVPDADGWRLDGRKVLVTGAHKADICVTVAVTAPDAPPRSRMTMFVVDLPCAGVTVRRRTTLNGWTLSEVDFERALVPGDAVLGPVHGGWPQLTGLVASERSGMAHLGWATRILESMEDWIDGRDGAGIDEHGGSDARDGAGGIDRSAAHDGIERADREAVARLRIDLRTGVHLSSRVMSAQDRGEPDLAGAAMAKVFATELLQRIARVGTDIVGLAALERAPLFDPTTTAPLRGRLAWEVLERIHPTISVGANELQRDLIARTALGLPRARA
jgi:alkylation response protein AidB-like acyl-CoA dehydrogenase